MIDNRPKSVASAKATLTSAARVAKPVRLLLLLLWMTVIFAFSHQAHSGAVTEEYLGDYNVIVRKFSHVSEYLILCLLFYWNLSPASIVKNTGGFPGASRHPFILAALFTIIYAASDEWHQSFVPGRSASAFDVMVDCIGVVIASALLFAFCRLNFHKNSMREKRD